MNSFQLAVELRAALDLPAAASFKHVSPAGAAVAVPLTDAEHAAYEISDRRLTPASLAYVRARHADPLCSFGDWAALSGERLSSAAISILLFEHPCFYYTTCPALTHAIPCNGHQTWLMRRQLTSFALVGQVLEPTCLLMPSLTSFGCTEVSDGIIAPGYTDAALAILAKKKGGSFIVLQGDPAAIAASNGIEYREGELDTAPTSTIHMSEQCTPLHSVSSDAFLVRGDCSAGFY